MGYLYAQGAHVNLKTYILLLYYQQSTIYSQQSDVGPIYFTFCDTQLV